MIFTTLFICAVCWSFLNNYCFLRKIDSLDTLDTLDQLLYFYEKKLKNANAGPSSSFSWDF